MAVGMIIKQPEERTDELVMSRDIHMVELYPSDVAGRYRALEARSRI